MPALFTTPGNLLYVGACVRHFTAGAELHQAGQRITLLEVWRPWLDELMASDRALYITEAICSDVRDHTGNGFDYAVWLHGPEHMEKDAAFDVLARLPSQARVGVVGCPDGWMVNPARDGNPYAEHKSAWHVADFKRLGWQTAQLEGEVLAWYGA